MVTHLDFNARLAEDIEELAEVVREGRLHDFVRSIVQMSPVKAAMVCNAVIYPLPEELKRKFYKMLGVKAYEEYLLIKKDETNV